MNFTVPDFEVERNLRAVFPAGRACANVLTACIILMTMAKPFWQMSPNALLATVAR